MSNPANPHALLLYDHPSSPCARRVRITLLEKGLAWETQLIDLSRLEQRSAEYLRLNPNGFVPTLAHGERVIYESNVITEYLDAAFPAVRLYPHDPWELAQVKMWQAAELAMAKDYRPLMYQRLMGPMVRLTRTLEEALAAARRSTSAAADLAWEEKVWKLEVLTPEQEEQTEARLWSWLDRLERHLDGRQFLVGDRFTQAEVSVFPRLMMYAFVRLPIDAARHPRVTAWMERQRERPSFVATQTAADTQLAGITRGPLLPWLSRTLQKPERQRSLGERARLWTTRRAALRQMGESARGGAERPALRPPAAGAVPPTDQPTPRPTIDPALRTAPITLYDHPLSPHGRRIRILLREKGLEWTTVEVDLPRLAHKAPAYLALNPNGELPTLRHGERIVIDSGLIAEYLDRVYAGVPLFPDHPFLAAQTRMWLALEAGAHKEFRPLFWLYAVRPLLTSRNVRADELPTLVPDGVDASHVAWLRDTLAGTPRFDTSELLARELIHKKLDVLEYALRSRDYLVGDALSMADVAWFTRLDLLPQLGVDTDRARHPNLRRWFERLSARPSFQETATHR
ncbi:MAG: glutathione S-transferase family protein [bacterium]